MSAALHIGIGPIRGTVPDRVLERRVPNRTPPAVAASLGRGYAADGHDIRLVARRGTQYGHFRAGQQRLHLGEDLYAPAGSPLYAPFRGQVEAIYPSGGGDYGQVVVLRALQRPRLKLRLIHLRPPLPKPGAVVAQGDPVGRTYTPARFPGGDPSHLHLEAVVTDRPFGGKPGDRGNRQPFSVINVGHLFTSQPASLVDRFPALVAGTATALVAGAGYTVWRWRQTHG